MGEETSVRQILLEFLKEHLDDTFTIRELVTKIVEKAIELNSNGIPINIVYNRIGKNNYTSLDVTYELSLLNSMGVVENSDGKIKYTGKVIYG